MTVIGNEFQGEHIPEPTAKFINELPHQKFLEMTSALEDERIEW